MKKSTGILLFVIFIFIALVLDNKRTEHFGLFCDIVDNIVGRCRLKPELMNDKIYGPDNVEKWNKQCTALKYNYEACVGDGSPKIAEQEVETYDPETQITRYPKLSEVSGLDGNLCMIENAGAMLTRQRDRLEAKYGDYLA